MTVADALAQARLSLTNHGVESPALEAQLLVARASGRDRTWVLTHPEATCGKEFAELIRRRVSGEPLPYVLGEWEFFGRAFFVDAHVLIPRPETELLVEQALANGARRILDIGTGSGAIAVSLACEGRRVTAIDCSLAALAVARRNAERHGVNVEFLHGDFPEAFKGREYDLVVTNPPYVGRDDPDLEPSVRRWEPGLALFAGDDGLDFFRRLAQEAPVPRLLTEIGRGQAESVAGIFGAAGWTESGGWDDLAGIRRVLGFRRDLAP